MLQKGSLAPNDVHFNSHDATMLIIKPHKVMRPNKPHSSFSYKLHTGQLNVTKQKVLADEIDQP